MYIMGCGRGSGNSKNSEEDIRSLVGFFPPSCCCCPPDTHHTTRVHLHTVLFILIKLEIFEIRRERH